MCVKSDPDQITSNGPSRSISLGSGLLTTGVAPNVFAQNSTPCATVSDAVRAAAGKAALNARRTRPFPEAKSSTLSTLSRPVASIAS